MIQSQTAGRKEDLFVGPRRYRTEIEEGMEYQEQRQKGKRDGREKNNGEETLSDGDKETQNTKYNPLDFDTDV